MTTELTELEVNTDAIAAKGAEARTLLATAREWPVRTPEEHEAAGQELRRIKRAAKEVDHLRRTMTRPLDDSKARIMDLFRPITGSLADAESALKRAILRFQTAEERKRAAEEARRRAVVEEEQRRLLAQAEQAHEQWDDAGAEAALETAVSIPEPTVAPSYHRAAGTSTTTRWHAEVTDLSALVAAVAEHRAPIEVLQPNMTVLNTQARSFKAGLNYPGVRSVSEKVLGASAH